ncbi:hypothetical protein RB195_011315 [Necator americanus]|uniref:Uncharacterized protein n=1 Tax=Necator americanus TaxID=51031 RepID=A0ABR1D3N1_NECAM
MDEAVCMIFVRRLYNDGDTFCFEFPYNCGVVKDFPRIVYRIKNENCTTVSQFKGYVNWEFQRIRNSVNKKWRREKPKLNKVKSASSSSAPPLIL